MAFNKTKIYRPKKNNKTESKSHPKKKKKKKKVRKRECSSFQKHEENNKNNAEHVAHASASMARGNIVETEKHKLYSDKVEMSRWQLSPINFC